MSRFIVKQNSRMRYSTKLNSYPSLDTGTYIKIEESPNLNPTDYAIWSLLSETVYSHQYTLFTQQNLK